MYFINIIISRISLILLVAAQYTHAQVMRGAHGAVVNAAAAAVRRYLPRYQQRRRGIIIIYILRCVNMHFYQQAARGGARTAKNPQQYSAHCANRYAGVFAARRRVRSR